MSAQKGKSTAGLGSADFRARPLGQQPLHPHVQLLYVRLARAGHFLFPVPEECHFFHLRRPTLWMMWCGVVLGPVDGKPTWVQSSSPVKGAAGSAS